MRKGSGAAAPAEPDFECREMTEYGMNVKLKFFSVPPEGGASESELNQFLISHPIISVERQFIPTGARTGWAICVEYSDRALREKKRTVSSRVDYKEVLDEETFALFAELRTIRKGLADEHNVPAYTVATNEQLAEIARQRATKVSDLKKIDGFGDSRIEKYGAALLACVERPVGKVD